MSAPPISSPFTKTCGIVGQSESAESSWRICGSGRMSTAVIGAPGVPERLERAHASCRTPAAGRALHEERDGLVVDHLLDLVAQRHAGPFRRDAELVDGAVGERRGERAVDEAVLLDQRQPVERRARDRHVEVVAAAGAVDDVDLLRRGTRLRAARGSSRPPSAMMLTTVRLPPRLPRSRCPSGSCARSPPLLGGTRPRDGAARAAAPRAPVAAVRGDGEEPAAGHDRARRRRAGARRRSRSSTSPTPGKLAVRKGAGNVVELGSIAAFGFSPLWLLAAAADVTHGSRVYLDAFVAELEARACSRRESTLGTVDELLGALEGVVGHERAADRHPAARGRGAAPRRSRDLAPGRLRRCPRPASSRALFDGLRETARREERSLLEVSVGIGLAFFNSARHVGRQHVLDPYREDLRPVRDEGFAAYAARVSRRYAQAVARHFDPDEPHAHRARSRRCVARRGLRQRESASAAAGERPRASRRAAAPLGERCPARAGTWDLRPGGATSATRRRSPCR